LGSVSFFIRETTGETTDDDPSVLYDDDNIYRKTTLLSSHRNAYCLPEGRQSSRASGNGRVRWRRRFPITRPENNAIIERPSAGRATAPCPRMAAEPPQSPRAASTWSPERIASVKTPRYTSRIWHARPRERQGSFPDEPIGANARLEVAHSRGPPPVPTERERLIARNSAWTPPRVPRARAARRTAARAPVRDPSRASVPEGRVRASTPREAPGHLACSTSHAV